MPIYRRGLKYQVSVGSREDRYRANFNTLEEAQVAEQIELLRRKTGQTPAVTLSNKRPRDTLAIPPQKPQKDSTNRTIGEAFNLTCAEVWKHSKSQTQAQNALRVVKALGQEFAVSAINPTVIRELVEEWEDLGNTGSTINKKLSALSMLLKTAADEEWIAAIPRIKRRPSGAHRVRWLDAAEEQQLLEACEFFGLDTLRDYIVCAIDTGFRRMELLNFHLRDYRGGMLHLHPEETKTSKARAIPPTRRVEEILARRMGKGKLFWDMTYSQLREQWALVRQHVGKADDPQFVVHMLRHTCASRLAMQDKPAQFIQVWMGHATPLTTARYMHLAPSKLREGKQALEAFVTQ